ncbi:MAG: DUF2339 domain-containing protein [Phycisphaerales bacterium]|nr:DUF2339 domain-containing protein [Phycisphaerales bacterium]
MKDDDRAQIEELQSTVNKLTLRVDALSEQLDALHTTHTQKRVHPLVNPPKASAATSKYSKSIKSPNPKTVQSKPAPAQPHYHVSKSERLFDLRKIEWLLGIKGLMLLGVVIVVIGVGMFLKLAHDEGWIGALSPTVRCGSAGIFGILLLGLGEFLRKKINPLASSGFSAAGIATMYASIYAASRMYNLFGPELAFSLLAIVSIGGVLLGAISNRVLLALLSLVGAFVVPVLLASDEPSRVILPGYLLFLLAMGLVLSAWKGGHFSHARRLAWWGTGIIGTLWLSSMYDQSPLSSLIFVTLAWFMTIVELAVSSRFFSSLRDRIHWMSSCQSGFTKSDIGEIRFNPLSLLTRDSRWINSLFGATIWAVIAAGLTIKSFNPDLVYLAPLSFCVASVVIIFVSMRFGLNPVASIASRTATPGSLLLSALLVNASLLLVATVAIAFGGWIEVIAWLAIGLGGVETARRFHFRAVGIFGITLMTYGIIRLLTYDLYQFYDSPPTILLFGLAFTGWALQVIAASVTFASAAWRSRYSFEQRTSAPIALWLFAASMLHYETLDDSFGAASIVIAAICCWVCVRVPINSLRINAFVLASIAMFILCMSQLSFSSFDDGFDIHVIPMLIAALAWASIAALPGATYRLRTISSTLVILAGAIAIGRIDTSRDTPTMLLAHAGFIGVIVLLGKRLFAWSLGEIASFGSIVLASGWCLYMTGVNEDTFDLIPFMSVDSFASIAMLVVMLYSARALPTRSIAHDVPTTFELVSSRTWMSKVLFGMLWVFTLIVSSLEVVRFTHLFFDTDSALGAAISIWWSIYAVASISLGFKLPRQLRWAGLTLLCIVGAKVLLLDTMTLAPAARIIASLTVGLIIIATGVLYSRLVDSLNNPDPNDPESSTPHSGPEQPIESDMNEES